MLERGRVAEALSRGLANSGVSADSLVEKYGINAKTLQRWLHKGITRTRGKTALTFQKVCEELKVDVWETPTSKRARELEELIQVVVEENNSADLISNLLDKVQQTAKVVAVAKRLAKDRPDLVPQELAGQTPFRVYFTLATEIETNRLLDPTEGGLYDRLLWLLLGKRALEEGKGPADWARAHRFFISPPALQDSHKYPLAVARLRKRGELDVLLDKINEQGILEGKTKEEREAMFWGQVAAIEQECQPLVITREQLQEQAARYPRAVPSLLAGDALAARLQTINEQGDKAGSTTEERRDKFWAFVKQQNREHEAKKPKLGELLRQAGATTSARESGVWEPLEKKPATTAMDTKPLIVKPAVSPPTEAVEKELTPEKQDALNETLEQAEKPQRRGGKGLGEWLKPKDTKEPPATNSESPEDDGNG
jgi:hypothetical protein